MLLKAVMLAELAFVPPLATGRTPVTPVVRGRPVKLVATPEVGVPKRGVTKVGEVAKTAAPLPVSSDKEVARADELMEPVAVPYKVPLVGRVTVVVPVWVKVKAKLPEVVRLLARVIVLDPLLTPVPP